MHIIKLAVEDNIYRHIMFLLKSLNKKDINIIEDRKTKTEENSIDFSNYKVKAFQNIENPVKWQQEIRAEWDNRGE